MPAGQNTRKHSVAASAKADKLAEKYRKKAEHFGARWHQSNANAEFESTTKGGAKSPADWNNRAKKNKSTSASDAGKNPFKKALGR